MEVLWRSDPKLNPIGMEARLVETDGERTLEANFRNGMTVGQKIKAIWNILIGKEFSIATIYVD